MKIKLGQLFKLSSGKSLPEKKRVAGDINVYGGNGITGKHNNYFVEQSTVVIGRVGEYCGAAHLTTDFCWVTDNALMVTEWYMEVNKEYIVYLLNALDLHRFAKTVGQPSISQGTVYDLEVELPELIVQEEVVKKLNKVKTIVDSRNIQIKYFDELIKARFVEMFGEPKLNPKGWLVDNYENLCSLITDGEHSTPKRCEEGIYLLSARNVLNHSLQLEDVDYIDEEEYSRIAKRIRPQENDILISCSGSVGRVCRVPASFKFQMVRSVAILRLKDNINPIFFEYLVDSNYTQQQILQSINQSSQANLFQGKIKQLKAIIPPIELQNEFELFIKQVNKSKVEVQKSLDEIQTLMNSLMKKYFG